MTHEEKAGHQGQHQIHGRLQGALHKGVHRSKRELNTEHSTHTRAGDGGKRLRLYPRKEAIMEKFSDWLKSSGNWYDLFSFASTEDYSSVTNGIKPMIRARLIATVKRR